MFRNTRDILESLDSVRRGGEYEILPTATAELEDAELIIEGAREWCRKHAKRYGAMWDELEEVLGVSS